MVHVDLVVDQAAMIARTVKTKLKLITPWVSMKKDLITIHRLRSSMDSFK